MLHEDGEYYIYYYLPPKKFIYNGEIWHHLTSCVDEKDIIEKNRSWVKTSFKTYIKTLHKSDVIDRFYSFMNDETNSNGKHGCPHNFPSSSMKDIYEVFIEHLK